MKELQRLAVRMKQLASLVVVVLVVSTVACGGGGGTENGKPASEVVADVPEVSDVPETVSRDVSADEGVETDTGPVLPVPEFVHEEFDHPGCVPDGPFLVDRVEMVRTEEALLSLKTTAVLSHAGRLWVGTLNGLFHSASGAAGPFTQVLLPEGCTIVADLSASEKTGVLAACGAKIVEVSKEGAIVSEWDLQGVMAFHAFACAGVNYAIAQSNLCMLGTPGDNCDGIPFVGGAVKGAACVDGQVWVYGVSGSVWRRDGEDWKETWSLPGDGQVLALAAGAGDAWAAGPSSVVKLGTDGMESEWQVGLAQLPFGEFTSLAVSPDGSRWAAGHEIGATLVHVESGETEYFHSGRWLPQEKVNDLCFDADGSLWVATNSGLSHLYKEEISLADKADRMFEQLDKWFWRMDGFISAKAGFDDPWIDDTSSLWDDDNDGQWTQEGVGAFCYAYAVTGDEKYYEAAKRAVTNMLMLIDVPAVDFEDAGLGRGFVTRSLVRDDEGGVFASKAEQSNWHLVHYFDGHDYYWKDDTSSDETTGHFFGLPIYYDLCAKDDEERAWVAEHVEALAGYILDHNYTLVDLDGEPTTHGDWSPERLGIAVDGLEACVEAENNIAACAEAWLGAAYLDSIEILGHMIAAWHVTGNIRFLDAFEELIEVHRYDKAAMFHDEVVTWVEKGVANYCDHELADLAWLTLIRYDPDEGRREKWVSSMLASWEYEIGERNPLKALSMAAVLSDSPGLKPGIVTLAEYPVDVRDWLVDNSHRKDAAPDVKDRHGDPQFKTVLPYDEIALQRWDHNPYGMKGGGDGSSRKSPAFWLLPYWGLRYYGGICPPE